MNILLYAKTKVGLALLSLMISAAVFVGAFEISENIRYYHWKADFDNFGWFGKITIPSPDPALMWEYRPYGAFESVNINRYGFRDRDYESTTKPENSVRIAFAGDSVTFGMGCKQEETFVRQFEITANQRHPESLIQALNFAVDGYNTPQIYEMIRTKVLTFSPDTVIYVMCLNDFDFTQSSGLKIRYFKKPVSFFLTRIQELSQKFAGGDFHQFHFRKNKKAVFRNMLDMRNLLERQGVGFHVVIVPIFPDTFANYPIGEMHKDIGMFLTHNGILFLDLLEAFSESGKTPAYYASDTWHPNAKGHWFIAQQLSDWFSSLNDNDPI